LRSASVRVASSSSVRYTTDWRRRERRRRSPYASRSVRRRRQAVVGSGPCISKVSATRFTKPLRICLIGGIRQDNRRRNDGDREAAQGGHPCQEVGEGPRTKRTRPEPRQYTVADLERARDRVAAAERRIDNDRRSNPNRGRAGLERAQLELSVIESQLRLRGLLA
jgi:hypothetical protein